MYVSPNHPDYARLKGRSGATAEAPTPSGELLARFPRKGPRGALQEMRVVLDEYEGHPYLALRVWQRDAGGAWFPVRGRGCSIRLAEADGVAEALRQGLDRAENPAAIERVDSGRRHR